jgi:uncharacterized protein
MNHPPENVPGALNGELRCPSTEPGQSNRHCDFAELARTVSGTFALGSHSIHGPAHWRRVERNGLWLAERSGGDLFVVRLFAWFHDSCRVNEWNDPEHGKRGADYAVKLRGTLFDLEDEAVDRLVYACTWHTDQEYSDDPTIGACWDADRLDIGRVGTTPSPRFMSTAAGKEAAGAGHAFLSHTVDP